MITRSREYMPQTPGEPLPGVLLLGALEEWRRDLPRLERLRRSYENDRDILRRTRLSHLPNNRIAHGYAKYIVTMSAGYMIGKPVSYAAPKGMEKALQAVTDEYARTDIDSVDIELARHAAIYGRAVMIVYADENAAPRTATVRPENAFVVYDDTIESRPMFGVQCTKRLGMDGTVQGDTVTVYTDTHIFEYQLPAGEGILGQQPVETTEHRFGGLPMIEVWNDENEQGDFEQVQSLIDACDILESDRVNDTEQHTNALLVLTGATMQTDQDGRTPAQQIRQDRILALLNADSRAEYLTASLNQADAEVLKNALKSDIHKFSMVPDLTDENFAGNASGVAMKYKLLGLESLIKIKEPWFVEALRERLRLYANFAYIKGSQALDPDEVTITLTRALPVNELETAQMISRLQGLVPDKMLLAQVPFVDDVDEAVDMLEEQKTESAKRDAQIYGLHPANAPDKVTDPDANDDGDAAV